MRCCVSCSSKDSATANPTSFPAASGSVLPSRVPSRESRASLLLDEPMAALDRKLREETQFALKDIQRELGTTFLVVTHDQDEAMGLADTIALMRDGRIEQIGPPADLYERPVSRFVAGFIGETNVIEGVLRDRRRAALRWTTPDGAADRTRRPMRRGGPTRRSGGPARTLSLDGARSVAKTASPGRSMTRLSGAR